MDDSDEAIPETVTDVELRQYRWQDQCKFIRAHPARAAAFLRGILDRVATRNAESADQEQPSVVDRPSYITEYARQSLARCFAPLSDMSRILDLLDMQVMGTSDTSCGAVWHAMDFAYRCETCQTNESR